MPCEGQNSRLIKELPLLFNEDTEENVGKIMTVFFAYLLKLAVNQCNGRLIKNILVTVEEVNQNVLKGIKEVLTDLGYQKDDIRVISHSESFVYYTLNQNKDIWINKVLFLELNEYEFACRRLEVVRGREPHVADVKVEDLSNLFDLEMAKKDIHSCDRILADYMDELLKKHAEIRPGCPEAVESSD